MRRTRRGRRSIRAKMRRFISRLLSREAERDRRKAESINVLDIRDIARAVRRRFGTVDWRIFDEVVKGEILSDSRGEGVEGARFLIGYRLDIIQEAARFRLHLCCFPFPLPHWFQFLCLSSMLYGASSAHSRPRKSYWCVTLTQRRRERSPPSRKNPTPPVSRP